MQIAYLLFSLVLGTFLSYVWTTNSLVNTILKVIFSCWSLWTLLMLLGTLAPIIQHGGMRLI
jgi:hypothetical protein